MNEIHDSKNVVTAASIYAEGNFIVGDGNIIINLKEAAQYKAIEAEIQELNERFEKAKQKSIQYPDDSDFAVDLINIDSKRFERQKELETLKQEVIKLAEDFARIPINTERLKKAKAYFENGEFAEARAVLDAEQMGADLNTAIQREELGKALQEQAKEDRKNLANEYLILARLTATDFELPDRFEKTVEYFEQSLRAGQNGENVFAYAHFLDEHSQYLQATTLYEEALQIYRYLAQNISQVFWPHVAGTLNSLAVLHRRKNELGQAQAKYEEALQIIRLLARSNSEAYLLGLAGTLNNLAIVHNHRKELKQAQVLYEEVLIIYRSLPNGNSDTLQSSIAATLTNLGILHLDMKELKQAEAEFEEALRIGRALAKSNPKASLSDMAITLNNFGLLHIDKNELEQAQSKIDEALQIYRQLSTNNPLAFLPDLALTLSHLANLHSTKSELGQAQGEFEEALQIYRSLAHNNPQVFLPDVANTASNMALFYQNYMPDREKSLELVKEGLSAAIPFQGYLKHAQDSIRRATAVIRKWGLDVDEFLKESFSDTE